MGVPEKHCYTEARAAEHVQSLQEQIDSDGTKALANLPKRRKASLTPDGSWPIAAYKSHFIEARRASGRVEDVPTEEGRLKHLAALDVIALKDLTTPVYRAAIIRVRDSGKIAPRSVIHVHRTFALMMRTAVAEGLIPVNPCGLLPGDLPTKKDKDPAWRKSARFTREELLAIVTDERIPHDRRVFYAILLLGCTRFGEASALRWSAYDTKAKPLGKLSIDTSYSTKKLAEKSTKTEVPREMPVHPLLASLLAPWRASGWGEMMGRAPAADDLIVPSREGRNRNANHMLKRFHQDLERIGLRIRRQHDARRTFISLAREGGAGDLLKWCTHGAGSSIQDLYTTPSWAKLCAEVMCVQLDDADKEERPEAVTAPGPLGSSTLPSTIQDSSMITSGVDGTRKLKRYPIHASFPTL
jgi:integrase